MNCTGRKEAKIDEEAMLRNAAQPGLPGKGSRRYIQKHMILNLGEYE